jgi:hypothetical protein
VIDSRVTWITDRRLLTADGRIRQPEHCQVPAAGAYVIFYTPPASGAADATGRGSCGQARKRAAPLRSALTVTAPLSVAGGGGRDEGRPGKISTTACSASNKGLGVEASNGLVPFTRNESGELIGGLAGD